MKRIATAALIATLAVPAQAEEGTSLMEEGAKLFFRGLLSEMEPALDELEKLAQEFEPAMRGFAQEMGPKLRGLMETIDDWSLYEVPEVLPNGDIIIRRKPDAPDLPLPEGEIEI